MKTRNTLAQSSGDNSPQNQLAQQPFYNVTAEVKGNRIELDARELATVLAGLRCLQKPTEHTRFGGEIHRIASDQGNLKPLSKTEIDGLCERLNR